MVQLYYEKGKKFNFTGVVLYEVKCTAYFQLGNLHKNPP